MSDRRKHTGHWQSIRAVIAVITVIAATLSATVAPGAAAAVPAIAWTETTELGNFVYDGATGPDGSVIVGGAESGPTAYIRRVDAKGAQVWRSDVVPADRVEAVAVAHSGAIYATGPTSGNLAGTNAGFGDVFVRGLTAAGATSWTHQFGTTGADAGSAIAVGPDGSVFVGGHTAEAIATGGGGGANDAFVRKYSAAGAPSWTVQFGGTAYDSVKDIAVANDGTVWVVGGSSISPFSIGNGFIMRISSAGAILSTEYVDDLYAGTVVNQANGVALHPNGDMIVVGQLTMATTGTGFMRRYDTAGDLVWSSEVGALGPIRELFDVDVSDGGAIFAAGYPTAGVFEEGMVAGFTDSGAVDWAVQVHSSNRIFVAATTDEGVLVSSGNVLSAPGNLTRFGASGGGGGGGGTFTDVPADAFYAEAVEWLKAEGITTGTSATTYSPDNVVTRGQMAAFLHRLVNEPTGSPAHGFTDVSSTAFYDAAVAWLKAAAVTTGTSTTTYSPDDSVTRGQMAAFLWRLAGEPGGSPDHGFSDVSEGAFYDDAVSWLKAQGITTGTSATTYSPDDIVTRGQMAAFLHRMATNSDWVRPT